MQTNISPEFKNHPLGLRAEEILRSCVHCGFCTATCPTYQLLGDELDSPRGRIYLIKQVLEGNEPTQKTQGHLDRCLTCRSCETTCPSGVEYAHLLDIGRHIVEKKVKRPWLQRTKRYIIKLTFPYTNRFSLIIETARFFRPLMPAAIKEKIPVKIKTPLWPQKKHARKILALAGCVQPVLSPQINACTARVFNRLGIELKEIKLAGCCGALNHHLNDDDAALAFIKNNIDVWWPVIEADNIEAIATTASGCGSMIKDYGYLLRNDSEYAERAKIISDKSITLAEILSEEDLTKLQIDGNKQKVAFHSPCTLQHGLGITGLQENILQQLNFETVPVKDSHLCCGSAGTYSIFQPEISQQLKTNKLNSLQQHKPDVIATANIGCLHHLASGTDTDVKHWIELLDKHDR